MSAIKYDHLTNRRALRRLTFWVGVPIVLAFSIFGAYGQDSEATVKKMLSKLALVVASNEQSGASGTAFCVWSTPSKSYFLTNYHVVQGAKQVLVRPQIMLTNSIDAPQKGHFYQGRLYPTTSPIPDPNHVNVTDVDLSVIVIDVGNISSAVITFQAPEMGRSIGIAGFPSFQFALADKIIQNVSPSVHFGSVNSVADSKDYVEFDAVTDHGNSGGPLFDRRTGNVYGVVTLGSTNAIQNNLAIDSKEVQVFLGTLRLPYMSYDSVTGQTTTWDICHQPRNMTQQLRWERSPDQWWCGLPDAP